MDRVLVGVDGSDGSRVALRFAADEARQWGVPLVVIRSWEYPLVISPSGSVPDAEEMSKAVASQLNSTIEEVLGQDEADSVEAMVVNDPPVRAILDAASPRDLIVVGSRGLGGFRGLVLGSVSQQITHYAPCPVTIVHPPANED